jgi:hypothetical protein
MLNGKNLTDSGLNSLDITLARAALAFGYYLIFLLPMNIRKQGQRE